MNKLCELGTSWLEFARETCAKVGCSGTGAKVTCQRLARGQRAHAECQNLERYDSYVFDVYVLLLL